MMMILFIHFIIFHLAWLCSGSKEISIQWSSFAQSLMMLEKTCTSKFCNQNSPNRTRSLGNKTWNVYLNVTYAPARFFLPCPKSLQMKWIRQPHVRCVLVEDSLSWNYRAGRRIESVIYCLPSKFLADLLFIHHFLYVFFTAVLHLLRLFINPYTKLYILMTP